MRSTQDDGRENSQLKTFGLLPYSNKRSNKYLPDGKINIEGEEYLVELKTAEDKGRSTLVSTGRGVDQNKINKWKKVFWIFSKYRKILNTKGQSFELTGDHYFCLGSWLNPWFEKHPLKKVNEGTDKFGGLILLDEVLNILENEISDEDLSRVKETYTRGTRQNDPRMSWENVVKKYCKKIDTTRPKEHLKELIIETKNKR